MEYKKCTEVTMNEIYKAFNAGFSDYVIPMKMEQDAFAARFFGPEGNKEDLSFIAMEKGLPIGLILGGIRIFDGIKTMRCGTLCIAPDYRGQGISRKLFELHKEKAVSEGCKQLFLEVIKGNDRAVRFYEKCGYYRVYELKYYTCKDIEAVAVSNPSGEFSDNRSFGVEKISFDELEEYRNSLPDCHINWQSDTPYYSGSTKDVYLAATDGSRKIAVIAMSPSGKVNFIRVDPSYRNYGLGFRMIREAARMQKVEKVTVCLPNNASIEGFLRKRGFEKDTVEQYEMCLPL